MVNIQIHPTVNGSSSGSSSIARNVIKHNINLNIHRSFFSFVNKFWIESPYNRNMVVISTETYNRIRKFYENFNGLSYYCELEAKRVFSDVHPYTVTAILSKEWQKHTKHQHHNIQRAAKLIMNE